MPVFLFPPDPPLAPALVWQELGEPGNGGAMVSIVPSPHDGKRVLCGGDMLGAALSTDGGETWGGTYGLKSYEMADVTWHPKDPSTVWMGSMAGPYRSKDGGRNWELKRNGFPPIADFGFSAPVERVIYDPADVKHLLAVGGSSRGWEAPNKPLWGALWESRDAGESWKALATLTPEGSKPGAVEGGRNTVAMTYVPGSPKRLLALLAGGAGVFASDDGGANWKPSGKGLPHGNVGRIVTHPKVAGLAWVSLGNAEIGGKLQPGGVYVSRDGGASWNLKSNGLSQHVGGDGNQTARYRALAIDPTDPNTLYTNDEAYNGGVTYKTTDGGANWRPVAAKGNIGGDAGTPGRDAAFQVRTGYPAGLGANTLAVSPTDPKTVYGINTEYVTVSRDGGATWSDATSKLNADGSVSGRGWVGLCSNNVVFDPFRKGVSYLQAMDAGRGWRSADAMKSWRYAGDAPVPWLGGNDLAIAKDGTVYGATGQFGGYSGVLLSTDGGASFRSVYGAAHGLPEWGWGGVGVTSSVACDPNDGKRAWIAHEGKILATTDRGESWRPLPFDDHAIHLRVDSKGVLHAGGNSGVSAFRDGKWVNLGGPKSSGKIAFDADGSILALSHRSERGGLYRLRRGAWTRLLDDPLARGMAVDPTDAHRLVVTTGLDPYTDLSPAKGVYLSSDGGASWKIVNERLPMLRASTAAFDPFDPTTVVIGTYGRGFFRTRWPKGQVLRGEIKYASTGEDTAFARVARPAVKDTWDGGLLRNGSMTSGSIGADGWDQRWVERGRLDVSRDETTFRSAPAALRVSTGDNAKGQAGQLLDVKGGETVRVTGFVRSKGAIKVNIALQPSGANYTPTAFLQAAYVQNDSDWTGFDREFVMPAGTEHLQVVLFVEGNGDAWLDDVRLVRR